MRSILLAALCLFSASSWSKPVVTDAVPTLTWNQLDALPLPAPGIRSAYGPAPQQFGELRLPPGEGPFPVIVLVHGGCWLNQFDYVYITRLAQKLTTMGFATWTIEYRRLGDAGGGWPGTFMDAAAASDHLRQLINDYPLDLSRVIAMGHSAGGQLALWLAARHKLPAGSELYDAHALRIRAVVGLAAITDLHTYREGPPDSCNASVDQLLGGNAQQQPQRYAQTSPLALLPLGVPQWLIQGGRDPIVPQAGVAKYVEAAKAAGDEAELRMQVRAGHFECVAPDSLHWEDLRAALSTVFGNR